MREKTAINIQEPAVKELHTKRSCFRRSCTSSCGCLVFLIIMVLVLLNILSGSGKHEVKDIPRTVPTDIEVYETNRIQTIHVSDTAPSGRTAEIASYIPKFFLSTIYLTLGDESPSAVSKFYAHTLPRTGSRIAHFFYLLEQPISPQTQHIEISWNKLPAEPTFIQEFYTTSLKKNKYNVTILSDTTERKQLRFSKGNILGTIMIRDTNTARGTDVVVFDITLPLSQ